MLLRSVRIVGRLHLDFSVAKMDGIVMQVHDNCIVYGATFNKFVELLRFLALPKSCSNQRRFAVPNCSFI